MPQLKPPLLQTQEPSPEEVKMAAQLLFQSGDCVELRCPKTRTREGTISGYFDDLGALTRSAASLNGKGPGVYWTLNPVQPDLLARANNRLQSWSRDATKDNEIASRRWFLVDLDPHRPSGVSATEEERQLALERASEVQQYLSGLGWSQPIVASSGNGCHLLYRIELPNDDETTDLLRRCTRALASRFSDERVEVDKTTFNASRTIRVYGTTNAKGDSTPARPHRLAKILTAPEDLAAVEPSLLRNLAGSAEVRRQAEGEDRGIIRRGRRHNKLLSEVGSLIEKGVNKDLSIGAILRLNQELCDPPLEEEAVRNLVEDAYKRYAKNSTLSVGNLEGYVFDAERKLPTELVFYDGLVSQGDLIVWLGREKHRKTNLIQQFAVCAAMGRDFLAFQYVAAKPARVLYLDFESKTTSLAQRLQSIRRSLKLSPQQEKLLSKNFRVIEARRLVRDGTPIPRFPAPKSTKQEDKQSEEFWRELTRQYPVDIFVIDPMRCMHSSDENDSAIEGLLSKIRQIFKESVVIIAHHMRKQMAGGKVVRLHEDMRFWSDSARGSSAIKAHSDCIVCQERSSDDRQNELLHFGAFLKDGADVEPIALQETDYQSFCWAVSAVVPKHLQATLETIGAALGARFTQESAVVALKKSGTAKSTAYRHLKELKRLGFLRSVDQEHLTVAKPADTISCPDRACPDGLAA